MSAFSCGFVDKLFCLCANLVRTDLATFLLWLGGKPATLQRALLRGEILWRGRGFYFVCDLFLYRFLQSFFSFFIHDKDYSVNRQDVR